jgi:hypothetical protein
MEDDEITFAESASRTWIRALRFSSWLEATKTSNVPFMQSLLQATVLTV